MTRYRGGHLEQSIELLVLELSSSSSPLSICTVLSLGVGAPLSFFALLTLGLQQRN